MQKEFLMLQVEGVHIMMNSEEQWINFSLIYGLIECADNIRLNLL